MTIGIAHLTIGVGTALAAEEDLETRELSILEKLEVRKRMPYWDEIDDLVKRDRPLSDQEVLRYFQALKLDKGEWSYHLSQADIPALRTCRDEAIGRGDIDERYVTMLFLVKNAADVYRYRIAETRTGLKALVRFADRLDASAVQPQPQSFQLQPTYVVIRREMKREGMGAGKTVSLRMDGREISRWQEISGLPVWGVDEEDVSSIFRRTGLMKPVGPFPGLSVEEVRALIKNPGFVPSIALFRSFAEQMKAVLAVAAKVGYGGFNTSRDILFARARALDREATPTARQQRLDELEAHLRALQRDAGRATAP